jgi:pyruvate/2-oxoglutarate dehydrogenase complex dihydrolipoamide acyltransferase (E2) component
MVEKFHEVRVPKWGSTMTEATIVRWHRSVGDTVIEGQQLLDLETDKIEATVDAPASGILVEVCHQVGDSIPVGQLIALIGEP